MPRLIINFHGAASWADLRTAATATVTALRGDAEEWARETHEELEDKNFGGHAFASRWTQRGAVLEEACRSGSGNARDGYGYDLSWRLVVQHGGGESTLTLTSGSYDPWPQAVRVQVEPPEPAVAAAVRQALRETLGEDRDDFTGTIDIVDNIRAARAGDPEVARSWLAEALAGGQPSGRAGSYWADLLVLSEELEGHTPQRLAGRLTETPGDLSAWQMAFDSPPVGWDRPFLQAVLARLQPCPAGLAAPPWGPPPACWRQLNDGLGVETGDRRLLAFSFMRALLPALTRAPDRVADVVAQGELWARSKVAAVWPEGCAEGGTVGLPLVRVVRQSREYPAGWSEQSPAERMSTRPTRVHTQIWLWGPQAGDCVRFRHERTRALRAGHEQELDAGIWVAITGSSSFQTAAEHALTLVSPDPWLP